MQNDLGGIDMTETANDVARRLREATFTKGRMRGGVGGQTIEAAMRSTFHEVSAWDLDEAADTIARLTAERDALRAAMVQHLTILDAELKEHGYAEVGTLRATVRNALAFATADNLTSRQKTAV